MKYYSISNILLSSMPKEELNYYILRSIAGEYDLAENAAKSNEEFLHFEFIRTKRKNKKIMRL